MDVKYVKAQTKGANLPGLAPLGSILVLTLDLPLITSRRCSDEMGYIKSKNVARPWHIMHRH